MANNKIQIKRSITNATIPALSNGELAYTGNGDILYIGHPDGTTGNIRIGGKQFPGTLTANQALVANATSGIDKIIVANAAVSQLNANGATGTAGQVLKSGGAGANSYWADQSATVAGSDTQVLYNDGGSLAGAAGLTFAKTSNNVSIANNLTVTANVASNNHTAGANYGGASAGMTANAGIVGVSSNTTVNASMSSSLVQVANSTGTANLTAISLAINSTVANTSGFFSGANVVANTTTLKVGNTTITTTNAVFGGTIAANGSIGSAGQALISAGAANTYWATIGNGTVTSVATSNGVGGGTITGTGTLYAIGNNGIVANSTGIWAKAANGISVDASGINVVANSGLISNSTGVFVAANTSGGLIANTTLQVKVAPSIVFDGTGNLAVNAAALSFTDLTVSGNLTVLGNLVSLNVATLAIEDSLVILAKDQASTTTYTDAVDSGFYSTYGNTAQTKYTGIFRDQSDSGIYKFFDGQIPAPTTTVDTTNVNFGYATLQTFLKTGGAGATGLISNSSTIAITANSTLNVAITANSLSLSSALATTSGGTGTGTYAVGDILIGNTSNSLTKLAAGSDGYVLQINGTGVVAWNTLDGGFF